MRSRNSFILEDVLVARARALNAQRRLKGRKDQDSVRLVCEHFKLYRVLSTHLITPTEEDKRTAKRYADHRLYLDSLHGKCKCELRCGLDAPRPWGRQWPRQTHTQETA